MYPPRFRYFRARTISEALDALNASGGEARILAGGQSLIPLMKHRLLAPDLLVDINHIPDMSFIRFEAADISIGAMTRHEEIAGYPWPAPWGIFQDAAAVIADVQVRNRGTLGGDIAQADPGGDWGPVLMALDARVEVHIPGSSYTVPIHEFFVGPYATVVPTPGMIRSIHVPRQGLEGSAYVALKRRAGDFAIASAAVAIGFNPQGACDRVGIAVGSVGPIPQAFDAVGKELLGQRLTETAINHVAQAVSSDCEVIEDARGSDTYKRAVVAALIRRAFASAAERREGV